MVMVGLYLVTFGWSRVIRQYNRRDRFHEKIRAEMLAARKCAGPVIYDVDPRAPHAIQVDAELRAWLDRALGCAAPARLAANVGVCWHNRHVFKSVYRFTAADTYGSIPSPTQLPAVTPFEAGGSGEWFILNDGGKCSHLLDRPISRAELGRIAPEWAAWDDRGWSKLMWRRMVHPQRGEPRERWDSLEWLSGRSETMHGEFLVLHDPRYSLSTDRAAMFPILGSWRDLESANAAAKAFNERVGIATCVVQGGRKADGW
jgi:hypothetical protein